MFPDWSLILNQIVALAIIFAPLEIVILANISRIRRTFNSMALGFSTPDHRKQLFGEIAHGVMRALSERAGSTKGVEAKAAKSELITQALGGGAGGLQALSMLPGEIDLPVVGKVTIGQALQLFQSLRGLLGGQLTGQSTPVNFSTSSTGAAQLP